jgi:hypothetical protein
MFTLLRNTWSYYRTCSLRFDIEENTFIEAFASLRFDTVAITVQRHVLLLEVSTRQGSELHLDVSTLQRHVLYLEVSTTQGPELHLDVSTIQRPAVLLLDVSTPQGPELHLDLSTLQRPLLHLEVSTLRVLSSTWTWLDNRSLEQQRPMLHLDVSTIQGHELQLDVLQSTPRLNEI